MTTIANVRVMTAKSPFAAENETQNRHLAAENCISLWKGEPQEMKRMPSNINH
jgi:hypothetical protein